MWEVGLPTIFFDGNRFWRRIKKREQKNEKRKREKGVNKMMGPIRIRPVRVRLFFICSAGVIAAVVAGIAVALARFLV